MGLSIAELAALDKWQKLLVAEIEGKRTLEEESWTLESGSVYRIDLDIDEDVFKVTLAEIEGTIGVVELDEYFTISDVNSNADSFYFNPWIKRLYVHTTDSDSPAALVTGDPKYSIVIHFWVAFSNRPKVIGPAIQKLLNPGLEWWKSSTDLYDWTESISGTSTISREATKVYNSKSAYSLKITVDGSGNAAYFHQAFLLRPGSKVKMRIRYTINGTSGSAAYVAIKDSASNVWLNTTGGWNTGSIRHKVLSGTSGAWIEYEFEFVAHSNYSSYIIYLGSDYASEVVYFDGIFIDNYRLDRSCKPLVPINGLPNITQSVGDYYRPDEQIQIGVLRLIDAFFFTDKIDSYIWNNSKVKIWLSQLADDYEDFTPFGAGITNIPKYLQGFVEFEIGDPRIELKVLPLSEYRFNSTDYPNCHASWIDKPVPIVLGNFYYYKPPECDTAAYKFKISQTSFWGVTIPVNSVSSVRKCSDGSLLTLTTDYTLDLNNGIVDVIADPGDEGIYCSGNGLEVNYDSAGAAVFYVEDLLYFYFITVNKYLRDKLDRKTIKDLSDNRTIPMQYIIKEEKEYSTILSEWKVTNIFQIYYGLDGIYYFPYYAEAVPDEAPHFFDVDYAERPILYEDTDQCFNSITIKADWQEQLERYDNIETKTSYLAEARHGVKKQLELEAFTYFGTAAIELAINYLSMHKNPPQFLEIPIKKESALLLNPTDKFYATWREKDKDGVYHYKLNDVVFRILSIEKDINAGIARVRALRDVSDFWNVFT